MPSIANLGERCCGCGACSAVCPKGCVSMSADALGFRHPEIDAEACVHCGRCEMACPATGERKQDDVVSTWWARAKDDEVLFLSSSGGVFGLLARQTLSAGGAVYGAAFAEGFKTVRHVRISSSDELANLSRSKYIQSSICEEVYRGVEADLIAGLPVLYTGTACQISGMRGYLDVRRVSTEGLILIDVVCHGVPSPELWSNWLSYREALAGGETSLVNFRSKTTGWLGYSVVYEYSTGEAESSPFWTDWYMKAFLGNASLRGSCFECPAKRACGSDLTLGDFWGVKERHPEAFDDKGVSAVVVNTEKGARAFRSVEGRMAYGHSSMEEVAAGNPSLVSSSKPYLERRTFLERVSSGAPMDELTREWRFEPSLKERVAGRIRSALARLSGRG